MATTTQVAKRMKQQHSDMGLHLENKGGVPQLFLYPNAEDASKTLSIRPHPSVLGGATGRVRVSDPEGKSAMDAALDTAARNSNCNEVVFNYLPVQRAEEPLLNVMPIRNRVTEVGEERSGPITKAEIAKRRAAREAREGVQCQACLADTHRTTACARPSKRGDTVFCPVHGCGVYGQHISKGTRVRFHTVDGPKGRRQTCHMWGKQTPKDVFQYLVLDRRGKPPLRVTNPRYCFIGMVLATGLAEHGDTMPPELEGRWPVMKFERRQDAMIAKLREFETLSEKPRSVLDGMTWDDIKSGYTSGALEAQIFKPARDGEPAVDMPKNSDDGGDFILDFDTDMDIDTEVAGFGAETSGGV